MEKVLIAMSGGVDSSLAAKLIKESGYDCVGCTMKLFDTVSDDLINERTCCSLDDTEDARSVALKLGIPYYVFNLKDEFRKMVIEDFVKSYENGLTPNPCVRCNRYLKFEKLYERAEILGCRYIATGHYARIEEKDGVYFLKKALDEKKDQSYFLYSLSQKQLSRTLFPLGDIRKTEVREKASQSGFENADKPESQDICFVKGTDYASFIEEYTGKTYPEGDFRDISGNVLGRHKGIIRYTVGQRRGLGIVAGKHIYVRSINPEDNTVTVTDEENLMTDTVFASDFNWISGKAPENPVICSVKLRYRQPEKDAVAYPMENGDVKIVLAAPQRAVSPGQAAVIYDGETVLGGGTVVKTYV